MNLMGFEKTAVPNAAPAVPTGTVQRSGGGVGTLAGAGGGSVTPYRTNSQGITVDKNGKRVNTSTVGNMGVAGTGGATAGAAPKWQYTAKDNPLAGIPGLEGGLTAPMSANEGSMLEMMQRYSTGQQTSPEQDFLRQLMMSPVAAEATPQQLRAMASQAGLGNNIDLMTGGQARQHATDMGLGIAGGGNNPFVDAAIQAAIRPIQEGLTQQLTRELPGRFTQAGQFVQPQGTSAFDRAAALATRGAANAMTDASSEISFNAYEAERGREVAAMEAALGRNATLYDSDQQRGANFIESEANRQQGQREAALDRQVNAATQYGQVTKQQLDNMVSNLQAQALPRLIQEQGIERGMEMFNSQLNALLSTLGIAAGVTRPVIANKSEGSSSGFNFGLR